MNKKLFIAFIALAACLGCARVSNEAGQDVRVAFLVANYVPSVKADVAFEGTQFKTSAWFHASVDGGSQSFMDGEPISWKSTDKEWSPSRPYFWPKNGYINFFSWANTPEPVVTEGKAAYGSASAPVALATDADPLLASAAYRFAKANANDNAYSITYEGTDVKGVPTLFHHMAAKVNIVVKFDASDIAANDKLKWDFKVNSCSLNYANDGYVEVNFTDPGTDATQAWPYTPPTVEWTWCHKTDLAGATPLQTVNAHEAATGDYLFQDITVVPQDITAATGSEAKLSLSYTLTDYWNGAVHTSETVNYTGADALVLASFAPVIDTWYMNYRYTYTVIVKPNAPITFDPAVTAWDDTKLDPGTSVTL